MRFLNNYDYSYDLTYNDVFLTPNFSEINSRFDVSLVTPDGIGTNIPIVVANMNAVAGKRMSETVARRGGITIIPQDKPIELSLDIIKYVKSRDIVYETPLILTLENNISEALNIIHKRSHQAIVIVDENQKPVGIFKESDAEGLDRFTPLSRFVNRELITIPSSYDLEQTYKYMEERRISVAPVVNKNKIVGLMTQKSAVRSSIYVPATDRDNKLIVGVAIGINGDIAKLTSIYTKAGADVILIDTAHGHQKKMIEAIKIARQVNPDIKLVAGNVVTAEATEDLINAGVDIVKVGVGPGAMCTTRMMTGVGRPQFSAILECSKAAKTLGKHIWADGGVKHPRDVALALAAGASNVMIGSIFAGTHESVGDALKDVDGSLYKENFGMASRRAVLNRTEGIQAFDQAKKQLFAEGISTSKNYINPDKPGVEDIIDELISGVRSAFTYTGAKNIVEFQDKAVVGVQSASGYDEGKPVSGF
jgi:IMP dehydrogenase